MFKIALKRGLRGVARIRLAASILLHSGLICVVNLD
jgi:hypothetical protein